MEYSTRDLVCLHLDGHEVVPEGTTVPEAVTVLGIANAVEAGTSVVDRIDLLADLRELDEAGLVRERVRPVETTGERRRAYFLTDAGERRAAELRERLADRTVRVTDGVTESVRLDDVGRFFEDAGLVRALARLTDDGTVPLDRHEHDAFVGRTEELERLTGIVDDLDARGGRAVLVTGEAGVGKSSLVEAFLTRLRDRNPEPAVGVGAAEAGASEPYRAVRAAFADLPGGVDPSELFDWVGDRAGDDPEAVRARRRAMFADAAEALQSVAEDGPVVFVVEDLHWADRATVDLLAHLVDGVARWIYPVLFVVTARPEVLSVGHPASDFVDSLDDDPHRRLALDPLEEVDTRRILQREFGTERPPAEFVAAVHEHTGGNPLFVAESARRLLETGAVDPDAGRFPTGRETLAVPETVTRVVEDRLDALDEPGRRVLALGAAIGESVPAELLAAASDLPEPRLRDYVDLLVESAVWERDGDDLGFVHGVVRETALDRLDPAPRRTIHRRVAEAIEAVHADDLAEHYAEVAHHYREAGLAGEAVPYYLRAGDRAADLYAHEAALDHYRTGLELAREAETATGRWAVDLVVGLGTVALRTGEYAEAADLVEEAREWASTDSERRRLAHVRARIAHRRGDNAAAIETAIAALPPEGTEPSVAVCRLLDAKTRAEIDRGEFDAARATARRLLDAAEAVGADSLVADAHSHLGEIGARLSDLEAAEDHYTAALETRRTTGDRHAAARSRMDLGTLAMTRGEYDRAREEYGAALETFEDLGDRHRVAETHNALGGAAWARDEYDLARDEYRAALETFEDVADRQNAARVRQDLGSILADRGEYDRARDRYEAALDDLETVGDNYTIAIARINLGGALSELGETDRARETVEPALETFREYDDGHHVGQALQVLGGIALAADDHRRARDHLEGALAEFSATNDFTGALDVLEELVELAGDHRPDLVAEYCERAFDLIAAAEAWLAGVDDPGDAPLDEAEIADRRDRFEGLCGGSDG